LTVKEGERAMGALPMDDKPIKMLSSSEVCEWLGISLDTLNKWFGMGLVGYKIDKVIRIPENTLWDFLEARPAEGKKPED
jgi:hypothetical protein